MYPVKYICQLYLFTICFIFADIFYQTIFKYCSRTEMVIVPFSSTKGSVSRFMCLSICLSPRMGHTPRTFCIIIAVVLTSDYMYSISGKYAHLLGLVRYLSLYIELISRRFILLILWHSSIHRMYYISNIYIFKISQKCKNVKILWFCNYKALNTKFIARDII